VARIIGEKLAARTGQSVLTDNKPGAGGIVGANYSARAASDGYTLFAGHVGTLSINLSLYKNLSYDPAKDFITITAMVRAPLDLVVQPDSYLHTVEELIKYDKTAQHALT